MPIKWKYNDGGRAEAGYKGSAGDCVTRAIAIATKKPYQEVYDALFNEVRHLRINGRCKLAKTLRKAHAGKGNASPRNGLDRKVYERYLKSLGWEYVPCMKIGSGCTVHLSADELPGGRIIVSLSHHLAAVINGVLHDTYDCSERATTIYPPSHEGKIPAKAVKRPDGSYVYSPERCVYGYYIKKEK